MLYNKKSDKERKDSVLKFRVNREERRQLERLSKETGQSFSNIFRLRVLGSLKAMPEVTQEIRAAIEKQQELFARTDISEAKKKRIDRLAQVARIAKKRIEHQEREKVRKYRSKKAG